MELHFSVTCQTKDRKYETRLISKNYNFNRIYNRKKKKIHIRDLKRGFIGKAMKANWYGGRTERCQSQIDTSKKRY